MKRDLKTIADLTAEEIEHLIQLGIRLKDDLRQNRPHPWLGGRTLAMIFEKPSLRTRVTFETGMHQLGGDAIYLAPTDIQIGTRETVPDIARNLSLWVDMIMARTFSHDTVAELSDSASVPVINGLSDMYHPCQVLADCMTLREHRGDLRPLHVAYIGDGNNMVHSWLLAASKLGFRFTAVCPSGYEPDPDIVETARQGIGQIEITPDLEAGTAGVDVLYTDVWTSMGQEAETERRKKVFSRFQINDEMIERAAKDVLVMHCLPAHRGEEITEEAMEGPNSIIFPQAENRLHMQKAIMAWLMDVGDARI